MVSEPRSETELYSAYGGNPILYDEDYEKTVDDETDHLLNEVYETFGCFSAWGLRNMTLREDPWKNSSPNQVINQESMKQYFLDHYVQKTYKHKQIRESGQSGFQSMEDRLVILCFKSADGYETVSEFEGA